jgi:hypothetical protein
MNDKQAPIFEGGIHTAEAAPGFGGRPVSDRRFTGPEIRPVDQPDGFGAKAETRGIAPAAPGTPLHTLQFASPGSAERLDRIVEDTIDIRNANRERLYRAARAIASPGPLRTKGQEVRRQRIEYGLTDFLALLVETAPPGPERSTAISRARESAFWALAAIDQE